MAKKKVFVSFDYEKDRIYYYLMKAWDANSSFDFLFSDYTSREIQSDSVSVVKGCLTKKIQEATYTLVIIGEDANKEHPDSDEIGYKNWQNFEVARSVEHGNKIVGVKIDRSYEAPEEMYGNTDAWVYAFKQESIIDALDKA